MVPVPESAAKMSPSGAVARNRTSLNPVANTFTLNPLGAVGKKPSGGLTTSGAFPAERVANGSGNTGDFPLVTCAAAPALKIAAPNAMPATANAVEMQL